MMDHSGRCTTNNANTNTNTNNDDDANVYQFLVVDSGPIIRLTGSTALWKRAQTFYTVPAALREIRDAKARHHLDQLPFDLIPKEPSAEGIRAIVQFAKQTGDYASLSAVDIQLLGLLYDLEREGCRGDMSHIRTKPKRMVGAGKVELMKGKKSESTTKEAGTAEKDAADPPPPASVVSSSDDEDEEAEEDQSDDDCSSEAENESVGDEEHAIEPSSVASSLPKKPSCWAALFDQSASIPVVEPAHADAELLTQQVSNVNIIDDPFGDAEEDILLDDLFQKESPVPAVNVTHPESAFPSLEESMALAKEAMANDDEVEDKAEPLDDEERKRRSLLPVSKSGKLYNSFKKYGHLMKPVPKPVSTEKVNYVEAEIPALLQLKITEVEEARDANKSRILGGGAFSGQGEDVDDDGQGWVTSTAEINAMKSFGILEPHRNPEDIKSQVNRQEQGPPIHQRAAVATTDFAMQNVVLQMNLELLSVDGMKIRKVKSWVLRCGACFKVHTNADGTGPIAKRLFCSHCGSDMIQRIAASVDGKTGRLRLHLKKNYRHNLRGTKYSLPKPGTGNKFQGDLLLREDQLLMGAWNQKARIRSGGKARQDAQSMFGRDLAGNVGCHTAAVTADDIRVGFGRQNPNAAKGRERRGKKKKTSEKACGLRRY